MDQAASSEEDNDGDWLMQLFGGNQRPIRSSGGVAGNSLSEIDGQNPSLTVIFTTPKRRSPSSIKARRYVSGRPTMHTKSLPSLRRPPGALASLLRASAGNNDHYSLCAHHQRMARNLIETARQARAEEDAWPPSSLPLAAASYHGLAGRPCAYPLWATPRALVAKSQIATRRAGLYHHEFWCPTEKASPCWWNGK